MTNEAELSEFDASETEVGEPGWRDALSEDLRDHPTLGEFADVDALAREHINLQKLIGRKGILPPGDGASEADLERFYASLGRPEQASDYDLSDVARPEELPWSEEVEQRMLERMHAAGLTEKQVRSLVEGYAEEQGAVWNSAKTEQMQALDAALDTLKADWGSSFDAKLDHANRAFAMAFGDRVEDVRKMRLADGSYLGDHPDMVRAFASVGAMLGEDRFVGEASSAGGLSSGQARQQLAELEGDSGFRAALLDRSHPDHRDALSRRSRLAAAAFGGETEPGGGM